MFCAIVAIVQERERERSHRMLSSSAYCSRNASSNLARRNILRSEPSSKRRESFVKGRFLSASQVCCSKIDDGEHPYSKSRITNPSVLAAEWRHLPSNEKEANTARLPLTLSPKAPVLNYLHHRPLATPTSNDILTLEERYWASGSNDTNRMLVSSIEYKVYQHCVEVVTAYLQPLQGRTTYSRNRNNQWMGGYSTSLMSHRAFSTKVNPPDTEEQQTSSSSPADSGTSAHPTTTANTSTKPVSPTKAPSSVEGFTVSSLATKGIDLTKWMIRTLFNFLIKSPGVIFHYLTHPKELNAKMVEFKEHAKKEAHHYWMGMKLLAADVRTARRLLVRTLNGSALTRRERKQLLRTTSDLFRLVPMSMFIIIPFMEFALPFALKLFPNMLPSTFQDSLKAEENMKRELQSRIAMAGFFQETLQDLAKEKKKQALKMVENNEADSTAAEFLGFLEKARTGEFLSPEVIIRFSKYFQDELTLDNLPRTQLVNLCKYMSITSYGSDPFLRFQLRHHIRSLKEDDQRILWEGIDSLTKIELSEACRERGMRSTGLSKEQYKAALQQWLDLSVNQNVPISLLIMSRSFFLFEPTSKTGQRGSVSGISDAISAMDKEVLNQVVLEVATPEERSRNPEVVKISLEVLEHENEKIKAEYEERQASKRKEEEKKKIEGEKKKIEQEQKKVVEEEKQREVQQQGVGKRVGDEIVKDEAVDVVPSPAAATKAVTEAKVMSSDAKASLSQPEREKKPDASEPEKEQEQTVSLSAEELNAIAQLISLSAVDSERTELERIKSAMMAGPDKAKTSNEGDKAQKNQEISDIAPEQITPIGKEATREVEKPLSQEDAEAKIAANVLKAEVEAAKASDAANVMDLSGGMTIKDEPGQPEPEKKSEEQPGDTKLDATMAQLKSKLEKMVGKIELQLSDVEMKIGNKMHFLDKDMDGLLTNEEVAQCLQLVLRRELTFDEAMAIANEMDTDQDGMFTVSELNKWIETNKIVKLAEQGRDAEVDKAIEKAREKLQKESSQTQETSN